MLPDEHNHNLRGSITGEGDTFCAALPDGRGLTEAGKGSWIVITTL